MISFHSLARRQLLSSSSLSLPFLKNTFSQAKKEQQAPCIERKKIINHFKNIFTQNINLFTEVSPSASVQTNAQMLKSMSYLSIENQNLSRVIKETIEKKLENEINPSVALSLLYAMCSQLEGDEGKLLKYLSDYFRNFFYLFDYEELKSVEYVYMQCGKHIPLSFDASLESEVAFKKNKLKTMNQLHTKNMIEHMKVNMPKGLNVVFSKDDNRIQINFSESKQNLIIYGFEHGDYKSILQMKELSLKDKSTRHFILEQPPLQYSEFQDVINEGDTNREEKLKQMMFGGATYAGSSARNESIEPDQMLKHYGQIPILSGDMIRFYINNFLLKQKKNYRLNDVERIIYQEEDGLAKPNEFATFIYNQMNRDKQQECKILLADLSIEDEIYHQITTKTEEDIKKQFDLFKIISINEQIDWAIKVGKSGCPTCTQGVKRGPHDIINASGETDYDFTLRERNLARQALHFMKVNKDADKFIMLVGNGHLLNVMKEILKIYNATEFKSSQKQLSTIQDYIEEFQNIKMKTDFAKYDNNLDFLNKFSLYSSYFKTNRLLLPTELRSVQNQKDYQYFRSQYQQQLHPDNFVNPSQRWVKQKGQDKCFALNLLQLS